MMMMMRSLMLGQNYHYFNVYNLCAMYIFICNVNINVIDVPII